MSHPVADDVIAVLVEIQHRFDSDGSSLNVPELRKEATRAIARIEVDAQRFANVVSAENSIHDACVRRLGYNDAPEFDSDVEEWLNGRSDALSAAVLARVTTEDQHQRLVEVLGISGSQPATPCARDLESPPAERVRTTVSRIIRDTRLSNNVKALHNYECQVCGSTLALADGSRYAEGHHVQPLGAPHNGPDVLGNIMCLCPNHHAACDLAAIELNSNELRHATGHVVDQRYLDYHNSLVGKRGKKRQA